VRLSWGSSVRIASRIVSHSGRKPAKPYARKLAIDFAHGGDQAQLWFRHCHFASPESPAPNGVKLLETANWTAEIGHVSAWADPKLAAVASPERVSILAQLRRELAEADREPPA